MLFSALCNVVPPPSSVVLSVVSRLLTLRLLAMDIKSRGFAFAISSGETPITAVAISAAFAAAWAAPAALAASATSTWAFASAPLA